MQCLRVVDFVYLCVDQDYSHYMQDQPIKQAGNYAVYDRSVVLPEEFQHGVAVVLSTECMLEAMRAEEPREKVDRILSIYAEPEPEEEPI